jgi:hypothetical protein
MDACKLRLMKQTINGKVFVCNSCNKFHVEYKNLQFTFSESEYRFFVDYFTKIDTAYWETINKNSIYQKKIMVPIGHHNFTMMFDCFEIVELRELLGEPGTTQSFNALLVSEMGLELCPN